MYNLGYVFFELVSVLAIVTDVYNQIESLTISKIDNKDYFVISCDRTIIYHTIIIDTEKININSRTLPIFLEYYSYLKNGNEKDFILDILYFLYIKKAKSKNKILVIKMYDVDNVKKVKSIFENISDQMIGKLIKKFDITDFNPRYLIYKDIVINNMFYDNVVCRRSTGYTTMHDGYSFVFRIENKRYYFDFTILDLRLEHLIEDIIRREFSDFHEKTLKLKWRANFFQLEIVLLLVSRDFYSFPENFKYLKKYPAHSFRHSISRDKKLTVLFSYQENLSSFFHKLNENVSHNRTFFVYEFGSIIGINKCIYSCHPANEKAFIISLEAYEGIKRYYKYLENYSIDGLQTVRVEFYVFASTNLFSLILRKCLKKRYSADFIILVHHLKFAELISTNEFKNLMTFQTDQIWNLKIYKSMVDLIINRILNYSLIDLLPIKFLYFHCFILKKIQLYISELRALKTKEKLEINMKKDIEVCDEFIHELSHGIDFVINIKLAIEMIVYSFSGSIGGISLVYCANFFGTNRRQYLTNLYTSDFTKIRRYLQQSIIYNKNRNLSETRRSKTRDCMCCLQ